MWQLFNFKTQLIVFVIIQEPFTMNCFPDHEVYTVFVIIVSWRFKYVEISETVGIKNTPKLNINGNKLVVLFVFTVSNCAWPLFFHPPPHSWFVGKLTRLLKGSSLIWTQEEGSILEKVYKILEIKGSILYL